MTAFSSVTSYPSATNVACKDGDTNAIANRPSLHRITSGDLTALQATLDSVSVRSDSYSQSASYYAMTGRKGLWSYATDETFMLIAAHPNRDNHLLLFSPMGKEPAHLLGQIVRDERIFADHIQLARMSGQDQLLLAWGEATGQFKSAPEELLDWKYPVHTLSTNSVSKHEGKKFRDFPDIVLGV